MAKTRILLTKREYNSLRQAAQNGLERNKDCSILQQQVADSKYEIAKLKSALDLVQRNREEELADKNRQIAELQLKVHAAAMKEAGEGFRKSLFADAELGRLVRQMPVGSNLKHLGIPKCEWSIAGTPTPTTFEKTPEEALRAAGVGQEEMYENALGIKVPKSPPLVSGTIVEQEAK